MEVAEVCLKELKKILSKLVEVAHKMILQLNENVQWWETSIVELTAYRRKNSLSKTNKTAGALNQQNNYAEGSSSDDTKQY